MGIIRKLLHYIYIVIYLFQTDLCLRSVQRHETKLAEIRQNQRRRYFRTGLSFKFPTSRI